MEAVIFDLDGTLIDSEKVHRKAYFKALEKLGFDLDYDQLLDFMFKSQGAPDTKVTQNLVNQFNLDIDPLKIAQAKYQAYKDLIETDIEAFPGAVEFVKKLAKEYKIALATSSAEDAMQMGIEKMGLKEVFDQEISGANLKNPKPNPDIFLLAAEKLGVDIKNTIIFEDSRNGLEAAKRSGAKVIAYDNKEENNDFIKEFYVIDDYENLSVAKLEEIYKKLEERWNL